MAAPPLMLIVKQGSYEYQFYSLADNIDGKVVNDIAASAVGDGFDSRVAQIGHSVANSLPPLRCFVEAVLPRS